LLMIRAVFTPEKIMDRMHTTVKIVVVLLGMFAMRAAGEIKQFPAPVHEPDHGSIFLFFYEPGQSDVPVPDDVDG
jgi:hypothetical protein